jgi:hypothetical protein
MDTDTKLPLKFDDRIEIAARGIERARRANLSGDRALADLVLRDLYGAGCASSGAKSNRPPRPHLSARAPGRGRVSRWAGS